MAGEQLPVTESADGLCFAVKVMPKASRQSLGQVREGRLVVYLNAPPVEGAANAALVKFLAKTLGIAPSNISILSGHKNRSKIIKVHGLPLEQARVRLTAPQGG